MSDRATPILSVTERGTRMTQLLPGEPIGQVSGGLIRVVLLGMAAWAVASSVPYAALLGLAPTAGLEQALGSPWALAGAIATALVAIGINGSVHVRAAAAFRQSRTSGLFNGITVIGGSAVGGLAWTAASYARNLAPAFDLERIATSPTIPRELGVSVTALMAALTAWMLIRLWTTLRGVRERQLTIQRLRQNGARYDGVIAELVFLNEWLFDMPVFKARVSYADRGEPRELWLHMRTDAERVPVLGSPVIVLTDHAGSAHVDLDDGVQFQELYDKYVAPSD
ncbi:MAG: hypothetical protein HOU81_01740 [Hamadaea sp.]|uniref:hypothetical protein n=1 Tax=Hamadaea sp. TaxID=2024425 RepID=UPI0017D709C3|nr:hypothetical protein [Hamadaea sp.]NUR69522.1 hypothetical protein [Hamadaea sp.]NUT20758.1 hypothetical protein [Hamadaea sp.]